MTRVGRRAAVGIVSALLLQVMCVLTAAPAAADIFLKRDRFGVLHFTNVPTDKGYQVMMREPIAVPRPGGIGASAATGSSFMVDSQAFDPIIAEVAGRYQIDRALVKAVIRAESGFQPRAVSRKGARGLMQLMPRTALQLGVSNAFDPQSNVEGGTRYLRELLERYNFDLVKALAAYNAGPRRVEQYRGVPPYYETHAYVARIIRDFNHKKLAQRAASQAQSHKPAGSQQSSSLRQRSAKLKTTTTAFTQQSE